MAGSMGPTDQGHNGDRRRDFRRTARGVFYAQAKGLVEGGADLLLVETCQDTRNIKAALLAIRKTVEARSGCRCR